MVFSGDFRHVQMRLMLASRLPSYGSMFKLCTYPPLTCVFICVQVHWLESLLMSISSAVDYIRIPPETGNVVDTIEELKAELL